MRKPRMRYYYKYGYWVMGCGVNIFGDTIDECIAKCRAKTEADLRRFERMSREGKK